MPKKKQLRKLLVVACGRSGTKHIANFLRRSKLQIGHEQVKEGGVSSAFFVTYGSEAGNTSPNVYQPYAHKPAECPNDFQFEHVWHQTRDPLKTIGSVRDVHTGAIVRWSKELLGQDHIVEKLKHTLEYAARHWLLVNEMSEEIAEWRYRVEDLEDLYDEIKERLNLQREDCPDVSKTMGRSYRTIMKFKPTQEIYNDISYPTWEDLEEIDPKLRKAIQGKAKEYGY